MKSLLVLTCLVAVCFAATNAKGIDTNALREMLKKVMDKRGDDSVDCTIDSDCAGIGPALCDGSGECVECNSDTHCGGIGPGSCDVVSGECVECTQDTHCTDVGLAYCDFASGECESVETVKRATCGPGQPPCPPPTECVANTCINSQSKKRSLVNDLKNLVKKWQN